MLLRPPSVGHCLAVWGANLHGNGRWMKRVYQGVARNPKVSPYGPLRAALTEKAFARLGDEFDIRKMVTSLDHLYTTLLRGQV